MSVSRSRKEYETITEQLYQEQKEREKNMEMKKMFGNLEFGPVMPQVKLFLMINRKMRS